MNPHGCAGFQAFSHLVLPIKLIKCMSHALSIFYKFYSAGYTFNCNILKGKKKHPHVWANAVQLEGVCEAAVCESWLSVLVGQAGGSEQGSFLPGCLLEFLYWLFESALSRSLPTHSSLHQCSPKSVTQIWHCITRSAPWNDIYIMCNIVHIFSLDYPQSINTLIYFGEKIKPKMCCFFSV